MKELWDLWVRYWPDLVIAVIFAVIVDLLRVSSLVRAGWRWVKDKIAAGSLYRLNNRIAEQKRYRDMLQSYIKSDKAFYLATLRAIMGLLMLFSIAGVSLILERLGLFPYPVAELMALAAIVTAIVAGIYTVRIVSFDNSKLAELVQTLDREIALLEQRRTALENAHNIVK